MSTKDDQISVREPVDASSPPAPLNLGLRHTDETLEIAHVLFMDIVGYTKLPMGEQVRVLRQLNEAVCSSTEFCVALERGRLNCRPTGDGMALVFYDNPVAPVKCALEISRALKSSPDIELRMGLHSGPVYNVTDITKSWNVAGDGINTAQRVMDCGGVGHILLSKSIADYLLKVGGWAQDLHDFGLQEVKHGVLVQIFNLCRDGLGNPQRLEKRVTKQGPGPKKQQKAPKPRPISLAVLPLFSKSHDPNMEILSDGITESIIYNLSQLPMLRVIARGTAFRYKGREDIDAKEIRRDLKVRTMFTGSLRELGDDLSISAGLVDVVKELQLWGERYKFKSLDLFALQESLSKEITEKLRLKLTSEDQKQIIKRPTENQEAYKAYLGGRYHWNKRTAQGLKKGIECFQKAIEIDPSYALAYAGLADCYNLLSNCGVLTPKESGAKAKAAALKALEIDDSLAEAHTSLARRMAFDWDWSGAEREYKRAIELAPNYATAHHWYGIYLRATGRHAEALTEIKDALELDPLSLIINTDLGTQLYLMWQYDLAIEQFRKTLEIDNNFVPAHFRLGLAYEQKGMLEEALGEFQHTTNLCGGDPEPLLGHIHAVQGRREEAEKIIDDLKEVSKKRYVSAYGIALIYVGLKEYDLAFEWLEKAYDDRDGGLLTLKVEPLWDGLRSDPRFADLLWRIGLVS
ncbi:MAG TPA: tetratricopeptide repeat protein [Pyrinomonadaceae bacterium]|jgi:TolB-like protein/Flp pilus assembly protein TadD/class 3 adenylate cyclase